MQYEKMYQDSIEVC